MTEVSTVLQIAAEAPFCLVAKLKPYALSQNVQLTAKDRERINIELIDVELQVFNDLHTDLMNNQLRYQGEAPQPIGAIGSFLLNDFKGMTTSIYYESIEHLAFLIKYLLAFASEQAERMKPKVEEVQ